MEKLIVISSEIAKKGTFHAYHGRVAEAVYLYKLSCKFMGHVIDACESMEIPQIPASTLEILRKSRAGYQSYIDSHSSYLVQAQENFDIPPPPPPSYDEDEEYHHHKVPSPPTNGHTGLSSSVDTIYTGKSSTGRSFSLPPDQEADIQPPLHHSEVVIPPPSVPPPPLGPGKTFIVRAPPQRPRSQILNPHAIKAAFSQQHLSVHSQPQSQSPPPPPPGTGGIPIGSRHKKSSSSLRSSSRHRSLTVANHQETHHRLDMSGVDIPPPPLPHNVDIPPPPPPEYERNDIPPPPSPSSSLSPSPLHTPSPSLNRSRRGSLLKESSSPSSSSSSSYDDILKFLEKHSSDGEEHNDDLMNDILINLKIAVDSKTVGNMPGCIENYEKVISDLIKKVNSLSKHKQLFHSKSSSILQQSSHSKTKSSKSVSPPTESVSKSQAKKASISAADELINALECTTNASTIDYVNDKVDLHERLGGGGSGAVVMRATCKGLTFAVKMLPGEMAPEVREGILSEIHVMTRLDHPNVAKYLGHDITKHNKVMLYMEYYTETLAGVLKTKKKEGTWTTPDEVTKWSIQIAKGLQYLHSLNPPLIHRDLKADNVFVLCDPQGNVETLKIGDFDTAKITEKTKVAFTRNLGTIGFMAPEVCNPSDKGYNEKADSKNNIFIILFYFILFFIYCLNYFFKNILYYFSIFSNYFILFSFMFLIIFFKYFSIILTILFYFTLFLNHLYYFSIF